MIDRDYCVLMARYNRWQNRQLSDLLDPFSGAELTQDRSAFFGSILATLNHVLWGDHLWMSRFDGGDLPKTAVADHLSMHVTLAAWDTARVQVDERIRHWADALNPDDMQGDLTWFSGATRQRQHLPKAQCVVQLFNHQIHHRGQVHAMITATGRDAPVSDLVFMPENVE